MAVTFSAFFFFLFIGMPIVFVLGVAAALTVLLTTNVPIVIISQRIFTGLNQFTLMAIPFFIFAGAIMDVGGISQRIVNFASAIVGWITGSLLLVSVVAAVTLAAISGSGSADTAAVSAIMQPELKRRRYDVDFAAGLIASGGSLAQIIPPSLMMVVMAMITSQSTGALFIAGIVPGFIAGSLLLIVSYVHAVRGGPQYRETEPFTLKRLGRTFVIAVPALGMPVIIIGGILGGVFTATESAAAADAYGLIVAAFLYRELNLTNLRKAIIRSIVLSAAVMSIIATASVFGWLVAEARVADMVAGWIRNFTSSPYVFLLIVNCLLLLVGMFMESIAAMLVIVPMLAPIAFSFGINPIHFGLVVVFNFAVGMITPPYGIALFVASSVAERNIVQVSKRLLWPLLAMIGTLALATYVPSISLYLPKLVGLTG